MRNALFRFVTANIGDDAQSYAVALHLPTIDALVDRDALATLELPEPHRCVMNSWFFMGDHVAPPSTAISPVFHGFCGGRPEVFQGEWLNYLRAHAPIGCRDTGTAQRLRELGIESYWSGCLTLFIGRRFRPVPLEERQGIIILDVDPEMERRFVPDQISKNAERLTNFVDIAIKNSPSARFAAVHDLMRKLAHARLVVTRRLHVALPCVGLGTPVLALPDPAISNARLRFSGFDEFLDLAYPEAQTTSFDFENPQPAKIPANIEDAYAMLLAKLPALGPKLNWTGGALAGPRRAPVPGFNPDRQTMVLELGPSIERCEVISSDEREVTVLPPAFPFADALCGNISARWRAAIEPEGLLGPPPVVLGAHAAEDLTLHRDYKERKFAQVLTHLACAAPSRPLAHNLFAARAHLAARNHEEAKAAFDAALDEDPDNLTALIGMAALELHFKQPERAAQLCDAILAKHPGDAEALFLKGKILHGLNDDSSAIACLRSALATNRAHLRARALLAALLANNPETLHESVAEARIVLGHDPGNVMVNRVLGESLLRTGQYGAGFDAYIWRQRTANFLKHKRPFSVPEWDGKKLENGRLLYLPEIEQGVGFEILAMTLISDLASEAGPVVAEVSGKLISSMRTELPDVEFCAYGEQPDPRLKRGDIAAQITFSGACQLIRRKLEDFVGKPPVFMTPSAPPGSLRPFRVGISWSTTNPEYGVKRMVGLDALVRALAMPGVQLVNLQYGDCGEEIAAANARCGADVSFSGTDFIRDIPAFLDELAAVDLVVSIDNSTVHFAGAIEKPCWVLLPPLPHWIWGVHGRTSPWFTSLRLYRSKSDGWRDVLDDMRADLALASTKRET